MFKGAQFDAVIVILQLEHLANENVLMSTVILTCAINPNNSEHRILTGAHVHIKLRPFSDAIVLWRNPKRFVLSKVLSLLAEFCFSKEHFWFNFTEQ